MFDVIYFYLSVFWDRTGRRASRTRRGLVIYVIYIYIYIYVYVYMLIYLSLSLYIYIYIYIHIRIFVCFFWCFFNFHVLCLLHILVSWGRAGRRASSCQAGWSVLFCHYYSYLYVFLSLSFTLFYLFRCCFKLFSYVFSLFILYIYIYTHMFLYLYSFSLLNHYLSLFVGLLGSSWAPGLSYKEGRAFFFSFLVIVFFFSFT